MRASVPAALRTPPRIILTVGLALVVIAGTAYTAVRAATGPDFVSALVASHSEKCLAVPSLQGNGVSLVQQGCDNGTAQQFEFTKVATDTYTVRNAANGGCVDVRGARRSNGAPLITWADCHGRANQQFTLVPVASGYQVIAKHSNRCLDVLAGSVDAGATVLQWDCGDARTAGNQVWRIPGAATSTPPTTGAPATTGNPGTPTPTGGPTPTSAAPTTPGGPTPTPGPTGGPVTPGGVGTNPDWGKALPPAGASLSRAYQLINGVKDKGYQPKAGECAWEIHARYWTWGADGKVYPTWHPARDASGCSFGHEHGDDPRNSPLFAKTGWAPFGYTNELLAPSDPNRQRNEDHVGHKVAVGNAIQTRVGNDPRARVDMNCDALIKFHQGTHSPDALASNLHELFYNVQCRYTDNGAVTEAHVQVLLPIGHPGSFNVNNLCDGSGTTVHNNVAAPSPADSPDGGFASRRIADHNCAREVAAGNGTIERMDELWQLELHIRNQGGLARLDFNPYMIVANASRFYDPAKADKIGRNIDLCYQGARGARCDTVRRLTSQLGRQIAWDEPLSPFNGAIRHFDPNRFVVQNNGPTTLYTDVFGRRWSTTSFPGAIKQFVSGNHGEDGSQGDIFMPYKNHAANAADGVRAPN